MTKIWIIGASEGIGRSLARELGKDKGNKLILSARSAERLSELSKDLGSQQLIIPLDVSDKESISNGFQAIKEKLGTIDILIYCAGYYKPMSADFMKIDEIEKMIDVNLLGAMRIIDAVVPEFVKRRNGHIILIGSIAGYVGLPSSIGYGASKAGIIHLAESLKCDLSDYNIKVQVINPGFVKTRLTDLNEFPMPFIMTPEKAARYITKAISGDQFESRFPFFAANFLKLISKLPYWLYFRLVKFIKPKPKT